MGQKTLKSSMDPLENSHKKPPTICDILTSCQFSRSITGPLYLWPWPYNTAITDLIPHSIFTGTAIPISTILNIFSDWFHIRSDQKSLHIFFPLTSVDIWFSWWCVSPGHHWSLYPDLCISIPSVGSSICHTLTLPPHNRRTQILDNCPNIFIS